MHSTVQRLQHKQHGKCRHLTSTLQHPIQVHHMSVSLSLQLAFWPSGNVLVLITKVVMKLRYRN